MEMLSLTNGLLAETKKYVKISRNIRNVSKITPSKNLRKKSFWGVQLAPISAVISKNYPIMYFGIVINDIIFSCKSSSKPRVITRSCFILDLAIN